jgi:hypothetical protein
MAQILFLHIYIPKIKKKFMKQLFYISMIFLLVEIENENDVFIVVVVNAYV